MRMTAIQSGEFDPSKEDWSSYIERLTEYFEANNIEQERDRAALLSVCGAETYQLIRDLLAAAKPSSKTYKQLVTLVQDHKHPKPSIILQRFTFHTCYQQEGEQVADFVAELRKCAQDCKFGDSLEDMLRDRLVCGFGDVRLQKRLLAEPELT